MHHIIEKSAFRRGEYVAYCKSGVQRIRRAGRGWQTYTSTGTGTFVPAYALTLKELGEKLSKH